MHKNFAIFILITLITLCLFSGLIYYSIQHLEPASVPIEAMAGKSIWQEKGCVECHTLFGHGGYNAPDLTKVYSRRGHFWIKNFLTNPPEIPLNQQKQHLQLTEEETDKIINYFHFVNQIKIPDHWPPPQKETSKEDYN